MNLGHTYLGPSSGSGRFIVEKRLNDLIVDFDTSPRLLVANQSHMKVDNCCVACRAVIQITAFLTRPDVELQKWEDFCDFQNCANSSESGVREWRPNNVANLAPMSHLGWLQETHPADRTNRLKRY